MNKLNIRLIIFVGFLAVTLIGRVNADRVFKYPRIRQEKNNWCWDACSQWILGFHGVEVSQTDICKYGFTDGKVRDQWNWIYTETEAGEPIQSGFNFPTDWDWSKGLPPFQPNETCYGRGINIIVENWKVPSKVKGRGKDAAKYTLSEEEFKIEIDNGHPFIVRYNWDNGGGHFVVAMGYQNKMCWLMNPWKDDGIQIYNYQWVMDGTDKNNIHHTWDYTLQTTKVDTSPELTAVFPKSVVPGKKYSVKLTSTKNGKDVTNCTFYTSLTEGLSIDSATRTISWTQTDKGPKEVKLIREFGNARDTIVNSLGFGTTTINSFTIGTESSIGVKNSGSHYIVHINRLPFSGHAPVIQVLTLNGKIIGEKRIVNPKESSITINKNNLAPGVYLLNISDGKRLHTEKLVF